MRPDNKEETALLPTDYAALLSEIKERVQAAQVRAALAVNRELVLLYWQIGCDIGAREQAQGWGAKVIERLARDLKAAFPNMAGFSPRNLRYMRDFAAAWPDEEILQQVVAKLPWGHNVRLLDKVADRETRLWYARAAVEYGWSRAVLEHQIDTRLVERQGRAITNFARTLPAPQSDLAQQTLKDPYNFDFLTLGEDARERHLEAGLQQHIREFLLEMGAGFAFVGAQYPLPVGDQDFFIDLLFYHLNLRCFVVIDLKMRAFEPEFAGKMNFYLSAVDDLLRREGDAPSIGIILCKTRNATVAEYALRGMNRPIGVAEHVTTELTRSLPAGMQSALPTIEELEAEAAEVPFPEESGDGDEDKAAREAVMSEMASLFDDEMIEPLSAATKAMKEAEVVTALPEPDDDPGSSDLPEGWTVAALGAGLVADVQPGFACGKHNQDGSGIAHLRPMNITSDGVISLSVVKFVPAEEVDREERHVRVGDVLFNNTNSPELVGKTAYYGEPEERAFSNHMTRLRCTNGVLDAKFCSLSLHQRWREGYFAAACNNHVSQASISRSVLLNTEVPLPPLTEQRRIVEQVEALLASVNAARARLESVPALLKRFRQSVLAAACSGRLTAEWREEQTDLEPTARLLERIRAERREKEGSRYREPVAPDTSELPELPGSWAWASMDELTTRVTSGSRDWTRYYGRGTGTFLMAQNIRPGYLDLSYRQIVDPPAGNRDRERSQVQTGDLLVTIVGANTGDLCPVISELPEHYVCQSVALMRPVQSALMPFLNLSFSSPEHGRGYFEKCFYGAGRPHLSFDQLRAAPVPLPPLVEQTEIVHRVKNLYAFAESIENRVEAAAKRTEKVTQAVLAKAFRGELVPTEAELARKEEREYEPASVLLQRVRTQPAEQQWIRKSRRTAARNGGTG